MYKKMKFVAAGTMLAVMVWSGVWASGAKAATINIFCSSSGIELELCTQGAQAWALESGNEVTITTMPANWDDVMPIYQQLLAARSTDVDVMILDGVWIGPLKNHLANLDDFLSAETVQQYFPSAVASGTVDGQFVAMPWYMDTGLLFYRKDLLEKYDAGVPQSWDELSETAARIQAAERENGNGRLWGYVWQGRSYEGLVCNALEWFASSGAGTFIDEKGTVTIASPAAKDMLRLATSWVGTISPEGVLNYDEEGARGVFQTGDAVFMRNWAYAWALAESEDSAIRGKVGVAPLPHGLKGEYVGIDGTGYLAVSKYSAHPKEAASLVAYLASPQEEKRRALAGSYIPTVSALFSDEDLLNAIPFLASTKIAFENVVARPTNVTGRDYPRISVEIANALHGGLSSPQTVDNVIEALAQSLEKIKARSNW